MEVQRQRKKKVIDIHIAQPRIDYADRDALDKAIDLYQEHVLHEGQQKNESLFEQGKLDPIHHYIY